APLPGAPYRATRGESSRKAADETAPGSSCVNGRHGQGIDLPQRATALTDRARSAERDNDGGAEVAGQRSDLLGGLDLGQSKQAAQERCLLLIEKQDGDLAKGRSGERE